MPDHIHLVWMGLRKSTDQRNGMKSLRTNLGRALKPAEFQHQAHDHVLDPLERTANVLPVRCSEYVLFNPVRAGLVAKPQEWKHTGAVIPGYMDVNPFDADYWPWMWKRYAAMREPGIEERIIPPRRME